MALPAANNMRLAASIGGSLAAHLLLMAAVPSLRPFAGHPADTARPAALTISLPGATPAPLRVQGEPALPPSPPPSQDAAHGRRTDNDASQAESAVSIPIALPAPEPPFFTLSELDTPPAVIQDIRTDPPELREYPQGGKLAVQLWIDETGKVVKTEVLNSNLPEAFATSARENFMQTVFHPAKRNGVAVKARVSAMIVYRPRS